MMRKESKKFYLVVKVFLFILFKMIYFFKSTGRKHIPKAGGCIIASNHLSHLDPIVLSLGSPRILSFLAKQDLFKGVFGKVITALNAFPVQRGKGDLKAIRISLDKLKRGNVLIVFPEGTRSVNGDIKKNAEAGVGLLAAKADVPVVPTFIMGSDKALPAQSKKVLFFTPISIHFAEPLTFHGLGLDPKDKKSYQIFSNKVLECIQELKNKNSL
ncbi:MAG: 1-acyl-sn-glycerol-3-phosphate acyltransferase [PVC group bacterium]|nr:1-acyl-sn-glycerol-3-phosphate acyltransferase [PVC group bacterium]